MSTQCGECGYRMISAGLRHANNGDYEQAIRCCHKCREPLEEIPDGYELE